MDVGDKVICINDSIDLDKMEEIKKDFLMWVKKDNEYTIREFLDNDGIVTGVLLEEIRNFPVYFKLLGRAQEPAFATWRFRKIERSTSYNSISEEQIIEETLEKF